MQADCDDEQSCVAAVGRWEMTLRAVVFDFGSTLFGHVSLADTIRQALPIGVQPADQVVHDRARQIEEVAHSPEELSLGRDLDPVVWSERAHAWYSTLDDLASGTGDAVYRLLHDPVEWHPYAASLSTVRHLHARGVPVGVLSNTGWDIRAVFRHHGLDPFITSYALSYEIGAVKPQRQAFESVCAMLGCEPSETLMVGDDRVADSGAVGAGMVAMLLPVVPVGADNGLGSVARLFA